jgi:hypothetical protein
MLPRGLAQGFSAPASRPTMRRADENPSSRLSARPTNIRRRASGVDEVIDKIEQLPVSQFDDDLRWKAYYAIYRDPFLSRYAPGGGLLWGHRHE